MVSSASTHVFLTSIVFTGMDKWTDGAANVPGVTNDLTCIPLLIQSRDENDVAVDEREFCKIALRAADKTAERHFVIIVK